MFIGHWPTKKVQDTVTPKTFVDIQKTFSKHMLSFLKLSLSPETLDFLGRVFRKAPFVVISFPQPRNPIKSTKKAKREALREVPRASPNVTKYPTSTYSWSCISRISLSRRTTPTKGSLYLIVERSLFNWSSLCQAQAVCWLSCRFLSCCLSPCFNTWSTGSDTSSFCKVFVGKRSQKILNVMVNPQDLGSDYI